MNRMTVVAGCIFVGMAQCGDSLAIAAERLAQRADAIRPTDEETRWQQIPWVRSVIEGQRAARAENRPIMYWHVDDDPLERC